MLNGKSYSSIKNYIMENMDIKQKLFKELISQKNLFNKSFMFIFYFLCPLFIDILILTSIFIKPNLFKAISVLLLITFFLVEFIKKDKNYNFVFWLFFISIRYRYINNISEKKLSLESYGIISKYLTKDEMSKLLKEPLTYKDLNINLYPEDLRKQEIKKKKELEKNKKKQIKENFLENLYKD